MSLSSFRIQPLRLDHIDAHIPDRLIAHELDSAGRILRVQLTDGGDVRDTTGTSLSLAWKHQRGASGLEPFSVVDAATGVYEVTYPSAMMLDGVATCSIQVAEGSSVAATRNFHVRIQDAPIDGDATASTETWTALQLILTQGQAAVTALEEQHTEQATEFAGALTDYQAQIDAAAASATEVYIGTDAPPANAVLWIDTTDGGKRVRSLVDGQWVEADAGTLGEQGSSDFMRYLPDSRVGSPINGFDANTVDRGQPSLIPMYNGVNVPSVSIGVLETIPYSPDWVAQYFHEISATNAGLYRRVLRSGAAWTEWTQVVSTDSGWVPIPPADSNYTSNAQARKVGNVVYLRGSISRADGTPLQAGVTPAIIPEGYRPKNAAIFMVGGENVTGSNAFFKIAVSATSGNIVTRSNPSGQTSATMFLDGVSWLVD